jgi:hypothetical protein
MRGILADIEADEAKLAELNVSTARTLILAETLME